MSHRKNSRRRAGHRCKNCDNAFTGSYCNVCGEKILEQKERTIRYFLGEFVKAVTFADTKLWRTIKLLYSRPGILPQMHTEGLRKPFIAPLALFFIVNLLYFFFQPVDAFNSTYSSQTKYQRYSKWAATVAHAQMEKMNLTQEKFEQHYNLHSSNVSKLMLILLPLMFSFPLLAMFPHKKYYFVDHLAVSLSFIAFLLLTFFILLPYTLYFIILCINSLTELNLSWNINNSFLGFIGLFTAAVYLVIALRNFYRQKWWWLIPKSLVLMLCFTLIMLTYRFILFVVTVATL